MSQKEKLIDRFLPAPADFTLEELIKVLNYFGFTEGVTGKTGGSRRRFIDDDKNIILLYKPHPANIVKKYAIRQIIRNLKDKRKSK
jgi:predicted RNA binding protein YcfA (HicA-like mRNA interferase family)